MILTDEERALLAHEMVKGCKSVNWLASRLEAEVLRKLREQKHAASISGQWRLSERGSLQRISNDGLTPLHIIPEEHE